MVAYKGETYNVIEYANEHLDLQVLNDESKTQENETKTNGTTNGTTANEVQTNTQTINEI